MIKIGNNQNRHFPIKRKPNQSRLRQTQHCKTECSTFVLQEQFNTITSYFKFFESIKNKKMAVQPVLSDSLCVPKFISNKKIDNMLEQECRQEVQLYNPTSKKMSQTLKEQKKTHKRYSYYNMEPCSQRVNWIKTILRRKNNGSYGQIVRGLTGVKHDSILEKAQAASSNRQANHQSSLSMDMTEKFVPLGSENYKLQPSTSKHLAQINHKKKISIEKKKSRINPGDYFEMNIRMKTQKVQKVQRDPKSVKITERNGSFSTSMKKKSQPQKIERHNLSPWDDI